MDIVRNGTTGIDIPQESFFLFLAHVSIYLRMHPNTCKSRTSFSVFSEKYVGIQFTFNVSFDSSDGQMALFGHDMSNGDYTAR